MKHPSQSYPDITIRLFYILAGTSCIANTIGFLSNAALYGFSLPTIACGICDVLMFALSAFGLLTKRTHTAATIIVCILTLFEFPFLYYVYGNCTIVYMLLGIVAIAVFIHSRYRSVFVGTILVYDTAVLLFSNFFPCSLEQPAPESLIGSTVCSFVIVAFSTFSILRLFLSQYEKQNAELREATEHLRQIAKLDPLTNVYNRRYLTEYLDHLMSLSGCFFSIALLDLDDFKGVNDRYGHVFGDTVLIEFSRIACEALGDKGIVARFGGEEFMIVFRTGDRSEIEGILEQMKQDFADFSMREKNVRFTFSGGVEEFHQEDKITLLFNAADEKLYQAKNSGKARVIFS